MRHETRILAGADTEHQTTWWELVNAIDEVTDTDTESFAVLETMLAEGRISFFRSPLPSANWRVPGTW